MVACHAAVRGEKIDQKQSRTAVSSCTGRVHVHVGCDSYDVRDVRGMLLGCLEQTKLMVLFAKHELSSKKIIPRQLAKTAVVSYTGRVSAIV